MTFEMESHSINTISIHSKQLINSNNNGISDLIMTQRIAEIIAEYMDKDVADINVEDTFSNIGLDSLDIMELVMQIEDEFDCKIELNQELNTITKLAEYIEAQK